ncbi:MAG: hypothetical protein CR982_01535 [Candidatus Cloacimonadota bacterium]|nr:MAG: hypothetical protein CR982_01535 [Candidatus Cloacimonadota bacterium]PIE78911.1 MAG: hypothetical protein CSA15_05410 [Candidatus Delongbacteria bacterium]
MKLPIGIQTFSKIREDDYIYVDKTKEALELIEQYQYIFLSRPRRFGKSLFLDTLKSIFEGRKEYFKGLYIEKRYDFSQKFPVIHISFSGDLQTDEGLKQTFQRIFRGNQEALGISCPKDFNFESCFVHLIREAYKKYNQKVVVLIDEYDKPILDNIGSYEVLKKRREQLKNFYSILKDNDKYLKFVFLTGVSKFSKVSIFSGLNNLKDISLEEKFGNICGYTHNDIETIFKPLLQGVDLEKLKEWYNGYYFLKDKVYNPFDILLFISENFTYKNYWFETGNPSFLIELIKKNNYYLPNLENIVVGEEILNSFEIENINLETLLFQSGYLTIKERYINPADEILYSLKMPNKEIKQSLNRSFLKMIFLNVTNTQANKNKALYSLFDAKLEDFKRSLISLFASLPYQNYIKNSINIYEGFYSSVIYSYLASLGFPISVEESTNMGRLDMSLLVNNHRYIFEFKVGNENALSQIKENRYYEKFLSEGGDIYLVGISFDEEKKNISSFEWEKFR